MLSIGQKTKLSKQLKEPINFMKVFNVTQAAISIQNSRILFSLLKHRKK